jgi:carboxyl-terminal processing protease
MNSLLRLHRTLVALSLPLCLASVPALAQDAPAPPPIEAPSAEAPAAEPASERVSLEEVRRFVSVFRAVQQAYVDSVDDQQLMQSAIRGLLTDLDPHSAYLDARATQSMNETATGAYGGLGLEILQRPDRSLVVIAPMDDTPAARAGIRPGDIIIELDGAPISADSVDAAVEAMRGEPGTSIVLTVVREGESEPLKLSLTREIIRVASARGEALDTQFAYIRIAAFQADTAGEVQRKLEALKAAGGGLKGLVLDLRRNPGGLLNAGIEVADLFLDEGVIVSTRGRVPRASAEYAAKRGDLLDGAPIVVLIDSGSASAAEVVAGALRDHRRALIMGSTSFGKGSVQTVLPLDNGDSIKLTTARYYTPNGTSIQATGIVPDIELPENAELRVGARTSPQLREADLPGHLQAESEAAEADQAKAQADYAVNEALNLLRGLAVFRERG